MGSRNSDGLKHFDATHGHYFPEEILSSFRQVAIFQQDNPSIEQARSGIKMIEVRQLTNGLQPFNEANLSWSEDGLYLGFEVMTQSHQKILLKDISGQYSRELFVLPKRAQTFLDGAVQRGIHSYNSGLRWSRDSTRYAFMSNGGVGEYGIYVGDVESHERPVARNQTKDGYAAWNPLANEIAFVSGRSGNGDIYAVNLADSRMSRLSKSADTDLFPEWFPDGRRLIFSSGDASNHDVMLVDRQSGKWSEPVNLTNWEFDDLRPIVSPDGRWIAFYSNTGAMNADGMRLWNIHVIPSDSTQPVPQLELARTVVATDVVIDLNTGPAWTPDSRKIFYVKRDPEELNPIYAYDLFNGERFIFRTGTQMNRDIQISKLGILSFRAQVGVWDRVFVALTNQGIQLQSSQSIESKIVYVQSSEEVMR